MKISLNFKYSYRPVLYCLFTICIFISHTLFSDVVEASDGDKKPIPEEWNTALTISGGISLGAYEAGMNWALVKILRDIRNDKFKINEKKENNSVRPNLLAVTGASAGGINALLTAMYWFDSELSNGIEDNLFHETWATVGFDGDGMLPKKATEYCRDDGLLSRKPFYHNSENSEEPGPLLKIRDKLKSNSYKDEGATIFLGLTLTLEQPLNVTVADITMPIQSMKVPMEVSVKDGMMKFTPVTSFFNKPKDVNDNDWKGKNHQNYITLTVDKEKNGIISYNDIAEAVMATSAFPVAFGRKTLTFCGINKGIGKLKSPCKTEESSLNQKTEECSLNIEDNNNNSCPSEPNQELTKGTAEFVDGGVFDNIPLGIAMKLAEQATENLSIKHGIKDRSINYIFMDPSRRRPKGGSDCSGHQIPKKRKDFQKLGFGLRQQAQFLTGAIPTARNSELYKVLMENDWSKESKKKLLLSNRYSPITGSMLYNFGAFFDKKFRELDYLIGVYDAIIMLSKEFRNGASQEKLIINLANHLQFVDLGDENEKIFYRLFCDEFSVYCNDFINKEMIESLTHPSDRNGKNDDEEKVMEQEIKLKLLNLLVGLSELQNDTSLQRRR
jgi:Patatin-like phospholipase